jgi:hypothetical protein
MLNIKALFKKKNSAPKKKYTTEILVKECLAHLLQHKDDSICVVGFDIPDNKNHAQFVMQEKGRPGGGHMQLLVNVSRPGSDLQYSNFLETGTREQVISYLKEPASVNDALDSVNSLSAECDAREGR